MIVKFWKKSILYGQSFIKWGGHKRIHWIGISLFGIGCSIHLGVKNEN